jgi:hypothetical protein
VSIAARTTRGRDRSETGFVAVSAARFLATNAFGGGTQRFLVEEGFIGADAAPLAHDRGNQLRRALAALLVVKLFAGLRLRHVDIGFKGLVPSSVFLTYPKRCDMQRGVFVIRSAGRRAYAPNADIICLFRARIRAPARRRPHLQCASTHNPEKRK